MAVVTVIQMVIRYYFFLKILRLNEKDVTTSYTSNRSPIR